MLQRAVQCPVKQTWLSDAQQKEWIMSCCDASTLVLIVLSTLFELGYEYSRLVCTCVECM